MKNINVIDLSNPPERLKHLSTRELIEFCRKNGYPYFNSEKEPRYAKR